MLRADEAVDTQDGKTLCRDAASVYRAICSRTDVRELYRADAALHEVPFTMAIDGRIVRGTIDCIIVGDDSITVLDFKTGRSVKFPKVAHNRLLMSLAHGFGHRIDQFGNPNFCAGGPLSLT